MAETREEGLAIKAKRRLLEEVIRETKSGAIPWKYAFHKMSADYYAEWRGRTLTIRSLQDEGPRLRVFARAGQALITYDPAREAIWFPREDETLVYCWEMELSGLNRKLCDCIGAYLKSKEREGEKMGAQEREQRRQAEIRKRSVEELREIKVLLGE